MNVHKEIVFYFKWFGERAMSQNGFLKQEYYEKHPWPRMFGVVHLQSLQLIPTRLLPYIIPNTFE